MFDLTGKVALVTGGGRGIGRGISLALARLGADVAVNFRNNPAEAKAVCADIQKMGRRALALQGDISVAADVQRVVYLTVKELGRLDILVNNAGIVSFEPFLELKEPTWDKVIQANLKGQFLCGQAAAREMVRTKTKGRIINIASIASGQVGVGFPNVAHYTASKGGVVALTETMALELGPLGITVNAVAPGVIETDMTKDLLMVAREATVRRIPLGRLGTPADVAAVVAFLASDEASYCTGGMFVVDGGWLAG